MSNELNDSAEPNWLESARYSYRYLTDPAFHGMVDVMVNERLAGKGGRRNLLAGDVVTDDSAEPLSAEEIERIWRNGRRGWLTLEYAQVCIAQLIATIDALTARVTELEGQRNHEHGEYMAWRQTAEVAAKRAAAAEHRIEELTAERDKHE